MSTVGRWVVSAILAVLFNALASWGARLVYGPQYETPFWAWLFLSVAVIVWSNIDDALREI